MLIFLQQMTAHYKLMITKEIRLGLRLILIFFVLYASPSCRPPDHKAVVILWKGNKAHAISVSGALSADDRPDSVREELKVHLKNNEHAILGDYRVTADNIIFTPVIAFTPGKEYEVYYQNKLLRKFSIPNPDSANASRLLSVYPSCDTVPENVLKLYLSFSAPMREGEALKHISLLNKQGDTLKGIFLDLQPELWNPERNVLTLWFDPGRIKRDLIPNLRLGNPLKKGEVYTLIVSTTWKDVQGLPLRNSYIRKFIVTSRDSISPDPSLWHLQLPLAGSRSPLKINFKESLDYFLLQEVISIVDDKENVVAGAFRVTGKEQGLEFHPAQKWRAGLYRLKTASHLEDLAGNNLERLFEHDNSPPAKEGKASKTTGVVVFGIAP
ncbi:MAG TPA: hypothetical protein VK616_05185 [Flavitalea sp.]|nr:hypothetical protein [Flavitalea sp.]